MSALEVKEGVVLDRDGSTVYQPESIREHARVRVVQGGWPLALGLAVAIPLLLFAGFAVFGTIAVVLLVLALLRTLVRWVLSAFH
jgi:hypothetical protein